MRRGLAVDTGQQNLAMEIFWTPGVLGEIVGEIIKEIRIRRFVARLAEIANGCDDAAPEILLPDSVDENARCQGVLRTCDPIRQRGAAAGLRRCRNDVWL